MASGDKRSTKDGLRHWTLLDGVAATDNGVWIDTEEHRLAGVIDISGMTVATVQIYGSNAFAKPANATDGRQIGVDIVADTLLEIGALPRWVKTKISAWTSGTIIANLTSSHAGSGGV